MKTLLVTSMMIIKIKPLSIMLLQMSTYVKIYDGQTNSMYFFI